MTYFTADIDHEILIAEEDELTPMEELYELLQTADTLNYKVILGTDSSSLALNDCGLRPSHTYYLLQTFHMHDEFDNLFDMLLIRDSLNSTNYSSKWYFDDENWNDDFIE